MEATFDHSVMGWTISTIVTISIPGAGPATLRVGSSEPGASGWFWRVLSPVLDAKNEAERHLRNSGLPYTIFRPGGLSDDRATGDVAVGEGGPTVAGSIPRADVALLMAAALETTGAEGRVFEIVARMRLRGRTRGVVEIEWTDVGS